MATPSEYVHADQHICTSVFMPSSSMPAWAPSCMRTTAARGSACAGRSWPPKPTRARSLTAVVYHKMPNCLSHAARRRACSSLHLASFVNTCTFLGIKRAYHLYTIQVRLRAADAIASELDSRASWRAKADPSMRPQPLTQTRRIPYGQAPRLQQPAPRAICKHLYF